MPIKGGDVTDSASAEYTIIASDSRNSDIVLPTVMDFGTLRVHIQDGAVDSLELKELQRQLNLLLANLKTSASPEARDVAPIIFQASQEADQGNLDKVLASLSKALKWALEAATRISASVAAEAIEKSMHLK